MWEAQGGRDASVLRRAWWTRRPICLCWLPEGTSCRSSWTASWPGRRPRGRPRLGGSRG